MLFNKEIMDQFGELDYQIYHYLLKHRKQISYMTIRELATESHVSPTTITRFCHKLGCNGFSEFKIRFKMENEQAHIKEPSQKNDADFSSIFDFFKRIETTAFKDNLNRIADVIASKKQVLFLGLGNSGIIADYASRCFCNMGIFSTGMSIPMLMFPAQLKFPQNSVFIALSIGGESKELIQSVELLQRHNMIVISITNSKGCTLAKISDYNIAYYIQRELADDIHKVDLSSQLPAVFIVEALAKLVVQKK